MIKIAIIEENEERQQELKSFLNTQQELVCSFAGNTFTDLLPIMSAKGSLDILIIGMDEEGFNNLSACQLRSIKKEHTKTEIIVLGNCTDPRKIFSWLKAGIVGYLPRHAPPERLKDAILGIRQGGAYITPVIVRKMLDYFRLKENLEEVLTEREKEIVQCLVEGMSYKLIAYKLNVALDTVRYHLRNIYKKLNVNSKAQVISKAVTNQG